jgi:hypothetical protein
MAVSNSASDTGSDVLRGDIQVLFGTCEMKCCGVCIKVAPSGSLPQVEDSSS